MRVFGVLVGLASVFAASNAGAQGLPTPADIVNVFSQAAQQVTTCPLMEIGPNVRVPMCPAALPKPPPGVVIPEFVFPAAVQPPSVDLRARGLDGPVMNQQQTGVCYAFAITNVLDNSLRRQGRTDVISPLHFVASGGYSTIFQPTNEALSGESSWPYDARKACKFETGYDECTRAYGLQTNSWRSDPQLVVERERARGLGVAAVRKATTITQNRSNGLASALSMGRSVYLVLGIDSVAWSYPNAKSGVLREYGPADRGEHAVAVVGYRWTGGERQFLLHNSWGTEWGDRGFVWIGEKNLERHFAAAYLLEAAPTRGVPLPNNLPNNLPAFPLPNLERPLPPLPPLPFPFPLSSAS